VARIVGRSQSGANVSGLAPAELIEDETLLGPMDDLLISKRQRTQRSGVPHSFAAGLLAKPHS
jgi:hypothetical protein